MNVQYTCIYTFVLEGSRSCHYILTIKSYNTTCESHATVPKVRLLATCAHEMSAESHLTGKQVESRPAVNGACCVTGCVVKALKIALWNTCMCWVRSTQRPTLNVVSCV